MCAASAFVVFVDILNDIFPGYDLLVAEREKEEALAREQERMEAEEMQHNMDIFMEDAAKAIEHTEKEEKR